DAVLTILGKTTKLDVVEVNEGELRVSGGAVTARQYLLHALIGGDDFAKYSAPIRGVIQVLLDLYQTAAQLGHAYQSTNTVLEELLEILCHQVDLLGQPDVMETSCTSYSETMQEQM